MQADMKPKPRSFLATVVVVAGTALLSAGLSCGRPVEPSYPSGEGWRCFHALPPADIPADHSFQGYTEGSRCVRSRSGCERLRSEALERTTHPWSARFRPVVSPAQLAERANHGDICAIDPRACPSADAVRDVRPAGFSACEEQPEATCSAWYRESYGGQGDNPWRTTCFAAPEECEAHLKGWYLHTVHRPCVSLR